MARSGLEASDVASNLIRLARPRQWTKNLAVFAAIVFSGHLFRVDELARVTAAFVALCLVASATYVINDIVDADRDRRHPIKCARPIASGAVGVSTAIWYATVLLVLGLALSWALGWQFFAWVIAYLGLQVLYTLLLKNVAIVDMLVIAAGFVIRAIAGAAVISVLVSPWLVLCTGLLALFLVAAKRRHEVVLMRDSSGHHRAVLTEYSAELLDSFMVTLSAATITSYSLYTFFERRALGYSLMLTIPFVIYGVLRYQFLVLRREGGGRPEEVMLGDWPVLLDITLWGLSAIALIYVLPRFMR